MLIYLYLIIDIKEVVVVKIVAENVSNLRKLNPIQKIARRLTSPQIRIETKSIIHQNLQQIYQSDYEVDVQPPRKNHFAYLYKELKVYKP